MTFWAKTRRFFAPAFKKPWTYIGLGGLASILGTLTGYIQIYMVDFLSRIFVNGDLESFWPKITILAVVYLLNIIGLFMLRDFTWFVPQFRMEEDLTYEYFKEYIKKDNAAMERIGTGRTITILHSGLEKWSILVNEMYNNIFRWIFLIALSASMLAKMDGWYGYGMPIMFVMIFLNTMWWTNKATHWRRKRKEVSVERSRLLTRIIMSKFEVLQNNRINEDLKGVKTITNEMICLARKSHTYSMGSWQISRLLIGVFTVMMCVDFWQQGMAGGITTELVAKVAIATGLMATFMGYFNVLIEWYNNFAKEFVHVERLWDFIDETPKIAGYESGNKFVFKKGDYEFQGLSFAYNKDKPVFKNLDLTIKGGKKTALVGRSGSGKTTLMKLLAGYMGSTNGALLVDGQDMSDIRLNSYYPHIGYLTQEPSVFDGTVRENLLYGILSKPKEKKTLENKIKKAIELAECQFIYDLEHGLDTEIGERGVRLSGGQKQRLAIAKIFLKDPEIILLDEPTASLDSYSEQKVAKAFEHLFEGRTVIVIAHRLQTVKSADEIIVLEKGKIIERGTHASLLKLSGKYAGMVDLQSGIIHDEEDN